MSSDHGRGPLAEAGRWLQQAQYDVESAEYCAAGERYSLACFMAQQAAEKAVAGYLYARGAEDVWGHALADLCEDARAFEPSFELIKPAAILLDKHYILARYPSALPGGISADAYDAAEAERAVEIAREVVRFASERVSDIQPQEG